MRRLRLRFTVAALSMAWASSAGALDIPTNFGIGADAEVRESAPTTPRGTSDELATRVADQYLPNEQLSDRNSMIFLQFDLSVWGPDQVAGAILRLTLRNGNLTENRVTDTDGVNPDFGQNGLAYYGIFGASFDEALITYDNAPGLNPDGDVGTLDVAGSALHLGFLDFPTIGTQNHFPVGHALDFSSSQLDAFLNIENASNPDGVAVIAVVHRNQGLTYGNPSASKTGFEPPAWINFQYLFNPKERITLGTDTTYEADVANPTGEGSPWSGADNSDGTFSPQLLLPGIEPHVEPINVDFGDAYGLPPVVYGGAAAEPGTWNRALIGTSQLLDVLGQPSGVTLQLSAQSDDASHSPPNAGNGDQLLLFDGFYALGAMWNVDLSGLYPGFYRVYLYAPSNLGTSTGDVDVQDTLVLDIPGDPSGALVEGTSWVSVDVEIPADTLSLKTTCANFCGLAGLQLVYLPEPSMAALAGGAALLAALASARRRSR